MIGILADKAAFLISAPTLALRNYLNISILSIYAVDYFFLDLATM